MKQFRKIISAAAALSICASMLPAIPSAQAETVTIQEESLNKKFMLKDADPSKVMWTTTMVETVDEKYGDVDPNASNKDNSGHQNPYNNPGENLTSWAYSEFLWTHSYPVGNGRMAGMVAGGIEKEIIQINEDTIWDGSPYGDIVDENGNQIDHASKARDAQTITLKNQTGGSIEGAWKYYRGADENGNPAPIGSDNAIVGDEAFRSAYPEFANKSISNQSLAVSNDHTNEAVQQRFSMESMVESVFLGNPNRQKAYKSFVELYLDFNQESWRTTNYTKSLDMETGVVMVDYDYMGEHFTRETFASYPDQAVVTHIESTDDLDFSAQLHTYHNQDGYYSFEKVSDNEIKLIASVYNGTKNANPPAPAGPNVIKFEARMYLEGDGAFTVSEDNSTISVNGGKEATIYIVGASNYVDYTFLDNAKPGNDCEKYISNIKSKSYEKILERHLADFTEQFNASSLSIENINGVDNYNVPTEKRVRKDIDGKSGFLTGSGSKLDSAHKNGVYSTYTDGDNELAVLEFNYGKYLTISGSRDERTADECGEGDITIPMSQPLNLTGKWNGALSASWNGKYTININTEMNYWPSQPLGLADSEKPLIATFADLAQSGAITAANQYAIYNDRGDDTYVPGDPWVMHHNYDLWRGTQPIDNATAGLWPTGGVWLLDHAWQYYLYNLDKEYLAEVYPYMAGAAKFFTQFLVLDPETGYLITAASCSPEQGGVQPGPAMDTQLVRNLYDSVTKAAEILGKTDEDAALLAKIAEQMPSSYLADEKGKLAPNIIDNAGLINEWVRGDVGFDFSEVSSNGKYTVTNPFNNNATVYINEHTASNNSAHRHCSNLWEMYPGTHLSAYSTDANEKAIYEAYKKAVAARGVGSGQGWGVAWRISLNARALDGEMASTLIDQLLTTRTSPNMFDQHPNFQIDGNYGATAGVIEMLLQSHDGNIAILPAIPKRWQSGQFNDFKARGNVNVSAKWDNSKLTKAALTPAVDGDLNIVVEDVNNAKIKDSKGNDIAVTVNGEIATFAGIANETYTVYYGEYTDDSTYTIEKADYVNGVLEVSIANDSVNAGNAVLAVATYAVNGALAEVETFDVNGEQTITTTVAQPAQGSVKVMLWDSVKGMKPLCDAVAAPFNGFIKPDFTAQPTIDPDATPTPSPTPTPVPTQPPMPDEDLWLASADDSTLKSGYYVMRNMSLLFDVSSAGKTTQSIDGKDITYYISSGDNGKWSSGTGTATGTALKYDATEDGTLTVYVVDLGANKELCITKEGVSDNKANTEEAVYYKNNTGNKEQKAITAQVKAGNSYYIYVAGSKGRFGGAEFVSSSGGGTTVSTPEPTEKPTPDPNATPMPGTENNAVYVGTTEYATINEAVNAIEKNPPKSEEERVYIDIAPGLYREQIVLDAPYVTMRKKADTEGDVLITWYYGLGSLYDSCNPSGYYDESAIGDGVGYAPKDWGSTLKVNKNANSFIAENLVIENSYNRYYTAEELTDITGVDLDTGNSDFHRVEWIEEQKANGVSDDEINKFLKTRQEITYKGVTSSPRERSCAFHFSADKAIVKNCEIISTQDTLGINGGRIYFEDCKLGGTTDYICGSASAVFNNCELLVNAGYGGESGTLTAPSNPVETDGYLFYNCHVTGTEYATPGNFGRPWSGVNASANYINTTIDYVNGSSSELLINKAGWTSMSGVEPKDARFHEYGSVTADGKEVDLSSRPKMTLLNEWTMLRFNPLAFTSGTDAWDPANLTDTYAAVNAVLNDTVIDTSDGSTNEIELPIAPEGFEFFWESDSEFATVTSDGGAIELIRPAYGEEAINATVKLYVREALNKEIGAEKSIAFEIAPTTDTENVFTISGTVSLSVESEDEQTILVEIIKGDAVIKTVEAVIPAGMTSIDYAAENIPVGTYTVRPSTLNADYNIMTEPTEVTGEAGGTVLFDIAASKMSTIVAENADFSVEPTVTSSNGFEAGVYTADGSETANLGKGNTVYKLTKAENATVSRNTGVSFNLLDMLPEGSTLANTKSIRFSYDFLMEKVEYMPSNYSYMDLATSTTNGGNDTADQTRFVRTGVHKGWGQLNFFDAMNNRINGDKTQFDKNNTMANRWYRLVTDIDLINETITVTAYDRDKDMEMLNGKPFTIAMPDEEGANPKYPTQIDLSNLFFNFYLDRNQNTTNKMEYYLDNLTIEYQDYE